MGSGSRSTHIRRIFSMEWNQDTWLSVAVRRGSIVLIPRDSFTPWLEGMNKTHLEDRFYWHVHIYIEDDTLALNRSKGFPKID